MSLLFDRFLSCSVSVRCIIYRQSIFLVSVCIRKLDSCHALALQLTLCCWLFCQFRLLHYFILHFIAIGPVHLVCIGRAFRLFLLIHICCRRMPSCVFFCGFLIRSTSFPTVYLQVLWISPFYSCAHPMQQLKYSSRCRCTITRRRI